MNATDDFSMVGSAHARAPLTPLDLVWSASAIIISAAVAGIVSDIYGEVAAALIFVLGITIAGALGGLVGALLAAAAAFVIFNFFMTEPVLTFRIATGRDVAPLVIFNLCALVTGVLAGRMRDQKAAAHAGNERLANLLQLSRALQATARLADVSRALRRIAEPMLGARITLFKRSGTSVEALGPSDDNATARELAEATMIGQEHVVAADFSLGLRLDGADGPIGALVLKGSRVHRQDAEFLDAFARVVALAVERADLAEQVAERRAQARAEELKTALLSSVSHDFRTPLTAISASASSLLAYGDRLEPETSRQFLHRIVDDCERLNRYTANLLEMSRLEAGEGAASLQMLSVPEMLGVAVQRVRGRARARTIRTIAADPDLLVHANPALFELVLINVLENAITYSEDNTRIVVACRREGGLACVSVADEGCGIPDEDLERVFNRFYRVARSEASPRGSGLGLAIAKGFVEALGGTIRASTPGIDLAGTEIVISLPLARSTVNA